MKTYLTLLAALLVLPLAACANDADDATVDDALVDDAVVVDDDVMDDGTLIDDDVTLDDATTAGDVAADVTLDGTIAAAGNDLTALEPGAALGNINGWINTLDGAEFTNATEIREGLMTLRDQLRAAPLDGSAIGATLNDLGTWTAASAPDNADIQTLAGALSSAGAKLTGM